MRMEEDSIFDAAIIEDLTRENAKLEETIYSLNDENAEMIAEVREAQRKLKGAVEKIDLRIYADELRQLAEELEK